MWKAEMERNKREKLYYRQIKTGWYLMTSEFECET